MNDLAGQFELIAIQEQAPQASKAEEPKSSKVQARKRENVMNRLGQVNPVGGLNLLTNTISAPPPLVAMSNHFWPLALQGNKDNRLDGADAGELCWERVSERLWDGNQRMEVLDFFVEFPETQTAEAAKELLERKLRRS